ncbi:MAG TPA: L-seryl-tRNA(Sec) selenium transferase [Chthonomonadaceae bacterium]|nr:L-seryl-tRNA(Sec) selenium transferase [Chthonomonadaceae bacterium]
MADNQSSPLARIPAVHRLLATPQMRKAGDTMPAAVLAAAARTVLARLRADRNARGGNGAAPDLTVLAAAAVREARRQMEPTLRPAVNATGIVLHTGLGRARLADAACQAIAGAAAAHATLEIDDETGRRGSRREHVRELLMELTGAEDAAVVNNCAGAVLLAVTVLAAGREVIVSRGELVEIGGAFRMPDIVWAGGATLIEVGTTNRTRLADYRAALSERTGLILRCHPSNFAIVGFTGTPETAELVALGREAGVPVMEDQGSGALLPPEAHGLPAGHGSLRASVAAGCDVATASGDKLLGGPQAGLLLGRAALVERFVEHPLARALRIDKLTLAGLEATLRLYRDPARALREIPTLRCLSRTLEEIGEMAERLRTGLEAALGDRFQLELVPEQSQVGGGSLPGEDLSTVCVAVRSRSGAPSADAIAKALRQHRVPVFGRIKSGAVLLDPRTIEPEEIEVVVAAAERLRADG